jgi:hypothetical protein
LPTSTYPRVLLVSPPQTNCDQPTPLIEIQYPEIPLQGRLRRRCNTIAVCRARGRRGRAGCGGQGAVFFGVASALLPIPPMACTHQSLQNSIKQEE